MVSLACKSPHPTYINIACNLPIGHSGPHQRVDWDPSDLLDCDVVETWPAPVAARNAGVDR